ncbi:MAG: hypothetical protein LBQ75_07840 [Zoogloeaceae bacterium]|nr:hypothetical protein [Zoogloeaceae bacterium]
MDDKNLRSLVWSLALVTLMALLPSGAWAAIGPVGYLIGPFGVIAILIYTGLMLAVAWLLNKLVLWFLKSRGWRWGWWLGWRWGGWGCPFWFCLLCRGRRNTGFHRTLARRAR